jgi:hypothetical protein
MNGDRLFIGVFPCGIVYADRQRNHKTVAFLSYAMLQLEWRAEVDAELKAEIERNAATLQARRGEQFEVSATGQTVKLGGQQ